MQQHDGSYVEKTADEHRGGANREAGGALRVKLEGGIVSVLAAGSRSSTCGPTAVTGSGLRVDR